VKVLPGLSWDREFTGRIADPSPGAFTFDRWDQWWRILTTERGTFRSYWVIFDEPQPDPDDVGGGVFTEAEVDERFLERLAD